MPSLSLTADAGLPVRLPPAEPKGSHLSQLDSLRGLAALYVLFHHILVTCWGFPDIAIPSRYAPWLSWLKYGHLSVTFFIILSGFVITLPLARRIQLPHTAGLPFWPEFFRRRARRILPPYFAALALSVGLLVWLQGWQAVKVPDLVGHLFLIHDWGVGNTFAINGALWSIPIEWHIYFSVPLLYLLWQTIGVKLTTILWILGAYAVLHFLPDGPVRFAVSPQYYGLFALGAAAAFTINHAPTKAQKKQLPETLPVVVLGSLCALTLFLMPWDRYSVHFEHYDLLFALFATALIVWLAKYQSACRRWLSATPLVGLGGMSYSLYLIHVPLLEYFDGRFSGSHLPPEIKFCLLCLLAAPTIIAVAYLFHRGFERPFMSGLARKANPGMAFTPVGEQPALSPALNPPPPEKQ